MLDKKMMISFLKMLTEMPTVECIRVDTNASWTLSGYNTIDPSKIILMCTYHPSQTKEEEYFQKIDKLIESGFKIGMINYVMSKENIDRYRYLRDSFAERGIPLHPNPLWDSRGYYAEEDLHLLKEAIPEHDFAFRTGIKSPRGEKCLFPAVGLQMDYTGKIHVGCHPYISKSFFDKELPLLFAGPIPCPMKKCYCLDMYSFLQKVNRNITSNPLKIYSDVLLKRWANSNN